MIDHQKLQKGPGLGVYAWGCDHRHHCAVEVRDSVIPVGLVSGDHGLLVFTGDGVDE